MNLSRERRILLQHVETDRLLGVPVVPVGSACESDPVDAGENQGGLMSAGKDKIQQLEAMAVNEVQSCTKCPLSRSRTNTVFGEGDPNAELMFIGEGPGQNEDLEGRPFVGRAGEMLTRQITAMGLTREQVYIANVVKCRPPNNRTPTPIETQTCWDYLKRQIQLVAPKVIVTLGGPATKRLLETTQGITAIRGTWHPFEQLLPHGPVIAVMPTFHPAYLLRAYTAENRKKVWSDLQQVVARLKEER